MLREELPGFRLRDFTHLTLLDAQALTDFADHSVSPTLHLEHSDDTVYISHLLFLRDLGGLTQQGTEQQRLTNGLSSHVDILKAQNQIFQ